MSSTAAASAPDRDMLFHPGPAPELAAGGERPGSTARMDARNAPPPSFLSLGRPRRIWAVGAVHGQAESLARIHDWIARDFAPGDRLIYLGNLIGGGGDAVATLDRVLAFRRRLLARPGMKPSDFGFLRGQQEEMLAKLLQIQFAPLPGEVLDWMARHGIEATLTAYGQQLERGRAAARDGAVALGRWTNGMRAAIRAHPGHQTLFSSLYRAAYGAPAPDGTPGAVLCVAAGIDRRRPLFEQSDSFWWAGRGFARADAPHGGFTRLVRGFDPAGGGVAEGAHFLTLDGHSARGGGVAAACLAPDGTIYDRQIA